jgi:hypothetical protein
MSQPKNAEPPAAAPRVPSTYASEGIGPEPATSWDIPQSAVYCDFETVFESATLRLKEQHRYRTFEDCRPVAFIRRAARRGKAMEKVLDVCVVLSLKNEVAYDTRRLLGNQKSNASTAACEFAPKLATATLISAGHSMGAAA